MTRARQLALALTIVVAGMVAWYGSPLPGGRSQVTTDSYSAPLGGAGRLEADLVLGAGTLRVQTTDTANAYEARISHDTGIRVDVRFSNGRLRIADRGARFGGARYTNVWSVDLTRRVPVDLTASTGLGRGSFDLTGMMGSASIRAGAGDVTVTFREGEGALDRLELRAGVGRFEASGLSNAHVRRVEARAGVGEFTLDFSGVLRGITEVDLRGGVGKVTLVVPLDAGVRVHARRGRTSHLNLQGFSQSSEDEYVNAAWPTATARLEVTASLGVGEFEIKGR